MGSPITPNYPPYKRDPYTPKDRPHEAAYDSSDLRRPLPVRAVVALARGSLEGVGFIGKSVLELPPFSAITGLAKVVRDRVRRRAQRPAQYPKAPTASDITFARLTDLASQQPRNVSRNAAARDAARAQAGQHDQLIRAVGGTTAAVTELTKGLADRLTQVEATVAGAKTAADAAQAAAEGGARSAADAAAAARTAAARARSSAPTTPAPGAGAPKAPEDNIIDAEVVEEPTPGPTAAWEGGMDTEAHVGEPTRGEPAPYTTAPLEQPRGGGRHRAED